MTLVQARRGRDLSLTLSSILPSKKQQSAIEGWHLFTFPPRLILILIGTPDCREIFWWCLRGLWKRQWHLDRAREFIKLEMKQVSVLLASYDPDPRHCVLESIQHICRLNP